jgi:Sulfotransferase domain
MIIWLASYPRSGNTFFRMLLYHVCDLKTYSIYNDPLLDRIEASDIVGHALLPKPLLELNRSPEICFVKTHDLPVDDNPAVYLVRDGRDALVSYAHLLLTYSSVARFDRLKARLKLEVWQPFLRDLIRNDRRLGRATFGGWSGNVLAWLKRGERAKTAVVRYDDLVLQPEQCFRAALDQLSVRLPGGGTSKPPSFEELHQRWPQFFRKGKSGAWRDEMSPALEKLFWDYHTTGMAAAGLGSADVTPV